MSEVAKIFSGIFLAILIIEGCSENEQQTTVNERENSGDEPKNQRYELLAENLEAILDLYHLQSVNNLGNLWNGLL
ncbi:hypothetical protein AB1K32_27395 [Metabacillus dongyingensis]|uniref:hypothetical protein n=1 Tax=Metabacillus dongyingensis TaxID=2874282 RepID=UPI003B8D133C